MKTLMHFAHPLFYISFVVLVSGVLAWKNRTKESRPAALFFLIAGVFLLVLTGWPVVFGPPADVAAIRNAEAGKVVAFEIGPLLGRPSSGDLVDHTVRVTDRAQIDRLVALLNASTHAAPNHPKGGWGTKLVVEDAAGRHEAFVKSTSDGLLIEVSGSAAVGRCFRNEDLKAFLEDVARR